MSLLVGNSGRGGECGERAECAVAMMEQLKGMGKCCSRGNVRIAPVQGICQQAVSDLCWLENTFNTRLGCCNNVPTYGTVQCCDEALPSRGV